MHDRIDELKDFVATIRKLLADKSLDAQHGDEEVVLYLSLESP